MQYKMLRIRRLLSGALMLASAATAAAPSDHFLYEDLGGRPGVVALVDTFATHLFTDPRIGPFFKDVDPRITRERLEAQFCDLAGGPCKTVDPNMRKTHSGLDITSGDFDAVIGLLKQSLGERGIPTPVQEQFLRKMAPMRGDIVNTP